MKKCPALTSRPTRIGGPLALGIAVAAGLMAAGPAPAPAQQQPPPPATDPSQAGTRAVAERIAAAPEPGEGASLAEIARARFELARQLYAADLRTIELGVPPRTGEGNWLLDTYEALHRRAWHVARALEDLDRPSADQVEFLRSHAARMREVAARAEQMAGELDAGFSPVEALNLRLLSLEARSWVLHAEGHGGRFRRLEGGTDPRSPDPAPTTRPAVGGQESAPDR